MPSISLLSKSKYANVEKKIISLHDRMLRCLVTVDDFDTPLDTAENMLKFVKKYMVELYKYQKLPPLNNDTLNQIIYDGEMIVAAIENRLLVKQMKTHLNIAANPYISNLIHDYKCTKFYKFYDTSHIL